MVRKLSRRTQLGKISTSDTFQEQHDAKTKQESKNDSMSRSKYFAHRDPRVRSIKTEPAAASPAPPFHSALKQLRSGLVVPCGASRAGEQQNPRVAQRAVGKGRRNRDHSLALLPELSREGTV
eukprot:TRINITY_DN184_c0_g1_i7.p2 TRINITY_DN184_c0_g1~~TRINITY_DN184_c0_g1_i7.p2  ORF type:complete len:123 (+),score=7.36 TRINITY_DN184_c0_g1_i7:92-460(+)